MPDTSAATAGPIHPDDTTLVDLARATAARTGTDTAAAVRDLDGRTWVAADPGLGELDALGAAVVVAAAGGSRRLESAVLVGAGGRAALPPATAAMLTGAGVTRVWVLDAAGRTVSGPEPPP